MKFLSSAILACITDVTTHKFTMGSYVCEVVPIYPCSGPPNELNKLSELCFEFPSIWFVNGPWLFNRPIMVRAQNLPHSCRVFNKSAVAREIPWLFHINLTPTFLWKLTQFLLVKWKTFAIEHKPWLKNQSLALILSYFHCSIIKAKRSTEQPCISPNWPKTMGSGCKSSQTCAQISMRSLVLVFSFSAYSKAFATYLKNLVENPAARNPNIDFGGVSQMASTRVKFCLWYSQAMQYQGSALTFWAGETTGRWSSRRSQVCNVAEQLSCTVLLSISPYLQPAYNHFPFATNVSSD